MRFYLRVGSQRLECSILSMKMNFNLLFPSLDRGDCEVTTEGSICTFKLNPSRFIMERSPMGFFIHDTKPIV